MAQLSDAGRSQDVAVSLLHDGPWASLPTKTVELLAAGGQLSDLLAGVTVYAEADAGRFGIILRGLLRVYMHTSDGRQVTVRYVRSGGLLGAPALVGGPAPVFVQAVTDRQPAGPRRQRRVRSRGRGARLSLELWSRAEVTKVTAADRPPSAE